MSAPGTVPGPWDAGLQPERTRLAWRRTTLAVAVGAIMALRVAPLVLGVAGLVAATGLAVLLLAVMLAARRRARATAAALRVGRALGGGSLLLGLSASVTGLGVLALGGILVQHLG